MSPRASRATTKRTTPAAPVGVSSPFVRVGVRERQRAATRERIFEAAVAELRRVGVANANVARIARAAGVSRPSFYAHFPTLDHVLFELTWRLAVELVEHLQPTEGLHATLDALADGLIAAERRLGNASLFREMVSIFARRPSAPGIQGQDIPVLGEMMRRFERARVDGELRAGMPPEQAARLCLSGVFGHLLGVDATPSERRSDLRALFSLYVA